MISEFYEKFPLYPLIVMFKVVRMQEKKKAARDQAASPNVQTAI
jgi:hypothetical protein